jgi:diaminohydroxyphosphoribosylaminopyrimidine deaminase / 5-amino-6-(5-phosphoribosylamino)uracil reductase
LTEFGRRRYTNILVEGGSATLGGFRDAGLIDEVHVFVAPALIGGKIALSPTGGIGADSLDQSLKIAKTTCTFSGGDLYLHGWTETIGVPHQPSARRDKSP